MCHVYNIKYINVRQAALMGRYLTHGCPMHGISFIILYLSKADDVLNC